MRGNGCVVAASTIQEAVVLNWYLEDAARVELQLRMAGLADAPQYTVDEAAQRATRQGGIIERMWAYLTAGDGELSA